MSGDAMWVTACIPVFRARPYLRESVLSLLNQTYKRVRVFVITDGDPDLPWETLADIHDPRLLRFELRLNKGPYFATAVALEATPDRLLLVQDADDVSVPRRLEALLRLMQHNRSDFATSALGQFYNDSRGKVVVDRPLYTRAPSEYPQPELESRIPHHGLFSVPALKTVGGYFGGFHFGYDELLTNLMLLTGKVSYTPELLYWRRQRPDSLTRSPLTGMKSVKRKILRREMQEIYRLAYRDYLSLLMRQVSRGQFIQSVRQRALSGRTAEDAALIATLAKNLRRAMVLQRDLVAPRATAHRTRHSHNINRDADVFEL
jgi:glycosyltransferase involved in cell wall biosynthesis